jgi:hypothetical protein
MESDLITRRTLTLVAVVAVGVVGSGLARRLLGLAGYSTLGRVVFLVGYATMIFVVWYVWIRPLDLTGPTDG